MAEAEPAMEPAKRDLELSIRKIVLDLFKNEFVFCDHNPRARRQRRWHDDPLVIHERAVAAA